MSSLELYNNRTVSEDLCDASRLYLSTGNVDVEPCDATDAPAIQAFQSYLRFSIPDPSRMPESWVRHAFLSAPRIGHRIIRDAGIHTNPSYHWETLWLFGVDPPTDRSDITLPVEKILSGTIIVPEWEETTPWQELSEKTGDFSGLNLTEKIVDEGTASKWRAVSHARAVHVDEMTAVETHGWAGVLVRLPDICQISGRKYDAFDRP